MFSNWDSVAVNRIQSPLVTNGYLEVFYELNQQGLLDPDGDTDLRERQS